VDEFIGIIRSAHDHPGGKTCNLKKTEAVSKVNNLSLTAKTPRRRKLRINVLLFASSRLLGNKGLLRQHLLFLFLRNPENKFSDFVEIKKPPYRRFFFSCGERGIRTPGPRKGSTVFETAPFDRSGISPDCVWVWACLPVGWGVGSVGVIVAGFVRWQR
jgi:hypothetical protein